MKSKTSSIIMQNKDIVSVFVVTAALLLLPYLAMQFNWQVPDPGEGTDGVNWSLFDFVIMGVLLSGTGLLMIFATRILKDANKRAFVIVALLLAFFLIWAELAVGLFGTPFAGS